MNPTGQDIKKLRLLFKESQREFAKRFGVSQPLVCQWERGVRKIRGPATKLYEMYVGAKMKNS